MKAIGFTPYLTGLDRIAEEANALLTGQASTRPSQFGPVVGKTPIQVYFATRPEHSVSAEFYTQGAYRSTSNAGMVVVGVLHLQILGGSWPWGEHQLFPAILEIGGMPRGTMWWSWDRPTHTRSLEAHHRQPWYTPVFDRN